MSAWVLVATSAWGLGWLAALGRPHLAGVVFPASASASPRPGCSACWRRRRAPRAGAVDRPGRRWRALAALPPLAVSRRLPAPPAAACPRRAAAARPRPALAPARHGRADRLLHPVRLRLHPARHLPAGAGAPAGRRPARVRPGLAAVRRRRGGLDGAGVLAPRARYRAWRVWAACQVLMALGVLLPALWTSLASVSIAAAAGRRHLHGHHHGRHAGSRARAPAARPRAALGRMTAGFALGQLARPAGQRRHRTGPAAARPAPCTWRWRCRRPACWPAALTCGAPRAKLAS